MEQLSTLKIFSEYNLTIVVIGLGGLDTCQTSAAVGR